MDIFVVRYASCASAESLAKPADMSSPDPKHITKKIGQTPLMPVFYHEDPEICKGVARACYEGGIRTFEFSSLGARGQENYLLLKKYLQSHLPEMYLGAGAVKDSVTAEVFISLNVDFIVSPGINTEIAAVCREKKVLWIPACSTSEEVASAEKEGATVVKLIPGKQIKTTFVKTIKADFPNLRFVPADGIELSASSIIPWLEAGVTAVSLNEEIVSREMLELNDYTFLKEHIKKTLKTIRQWKKQHSSI
jgi:2-dehydro-3-deoxyphosphogluconate aldolase/(4S)-4-hydroxy-2-oxoglutarate aldolase